MTPLRSLYRVRLYTHHDEAGIRALLSRLARVRSIVFSGPHPKDYEHYSFVAERNGEVVGFATVNRRLPQDYLRLHCGVSPDVRESDASVILKTLATNAVRAARKKINASRSRESIHATSISGDDEMIRVLGELDFAPVPENSTKTHRQYQLRPSRGIFRRA